MILLKFPHLAIMKRLPIVQIEIEIKNVEKAIEITQDILLGIANFDSANKFSFSRREAVEFLNVTVNVQNWKLNGLFIVRNLENGYRVCTEKNLQWLKTIRSFHCANYSLSSILKMFHLSTNLK